MNDDKERSHITAAQKFQIMKLIEANGGRDGEYWQYEKMWDDDRIAKEAGATPQSVAYLRKQVFGLLRKGPATAADSAAVEARVTTLELEGKTMRVANYELCKRVEHLEKALNILLTSPNRDSIPKEKLDDLKKHFSGAVRVTERMS